tara:strand:- start:343 stop:963 length:621 start_codon:yes stop_codon:yes gene_type:complete
MSKTEQEKFWSGEFGNEYISRNDSDKYLASNTVFFSKIFSKASNINSLIEFGPNVGMNIRAINNIIPNANIAAIEINEKACETLSEIQNVNVRHESILEAEINESYDLSLIKGVLIHINPDHLNTVYEKLFESSNKYILVAEYYNPSPVTVKYHNHEDRLFKRDFAGEMLDKYEGKLKLVDYGFSYHRDNNFPQDDITWFLMEKTN